MKRLVGARVFVTILLALILSGLSLLPVVSAETPDPGPKISPLLSLQVNAKTQLSLDKEAVPPAEAERIGMIAIATGMRTEDLTSQRIFIHFDQQPTQSEIEELQGMGITVDADSWIPPVGAHPTGFILADMPVDKLNELAAKNYIIRLNTAEQTLEPANDLGAMAVNANDVWGLGYDGSGIRIAVLDSGLDVAHPDIPMPIAAKDYSGYPVVDDTIANTVSDHGTHVAGSALGRGTQSDGQYKGVAPGADLIFLKIGRDADAHAPLAAMVAAIKAAVDDYHADVINMSYGGWGLYHDGTREDSQAVDYAFSQGAVVFISAGNEAAEGRHYSGTVPANGTTDFIQVNATGAGTADTGLFFSLVWFDGLGISNDLTLEYYDLYKNLLTDITIVGRSESPRGTESQLSYYNHSLPPGDSTWYLKVRNDSATAQFLHIYERTGASRVTFQNPDPFYTVSAPADADNAIAVGAYVTREEWTNYEGDTYWFLPRPTTDTIASFSSRGPRVDAGAPPKPNIAAAGSAIISCRDQAVIPVDPLIIDDDYRVMQGTSMAAPHAAGAAALLLQAYPELKGNPAAIRDVLQDTAGNSGVHDNTSGYGLIDILGAYEEILSAGQSEITVTPTSFAVTLPPDTTQDYTLTIGNTGDAALDYDITVQEAPGGSGVAGGESVPDASGRYAAGSLLLMERAGMTLQAPPGPGRAQPQHSVQTQSGWQDIMSEDFEDMFPGDWQLWFETGAANAFWGKCDYNPHTGSNSAFCAKIGEDRADPPADYPNNMNARMIYGPFSLEDATAAELNFWVWLDTELNYDWLYWVASVDGHHYYGWRHSGNSGGWEYNSFDLTDVYTLGNLCGQPQVWIAFIFESDSTVTEQGAFIDDVVLRKYVDDVNSPPNTPSNPSPANHDTHVSIDAGLSWTGGDPDADDTVTYDVYFGTSETPPFRETIGPYPATETSITYDDMETLNPGTTYYWKVVATDDHEASASGPVWEFTTAAEAPADFWLDVNPKSGSIPPGGSDELNVTIDTSGLAPGDYSAEIVIASNDLDKNPTIVPVALHVIGVPTVTTEAATDIGTDSATLNMSYTLGDYDSVEVRFAYRKAADATWTETSWVAKSAPGTHAETVTGLDTDTLYHFKAQLEYDTTEIEGAERQFTAGRQAEITGQTREVNCAILPAVTITLLRSGTEITSTVSDDAGDYELAVPDFETYDVTANKDGFRDETQAIMVDELTTHALDFMGSHGLIPNAPTIGYVGECIAKWREGELTIGRVGEVIAAWRAPISVD